MSLFERFSRDNVRKGRYWAKRAEKISVRGEYGKGALKRLVFFERAEEYMKACHDEAKFRDEKDDRLPVLKRQYLRFTRKRIIQEGRIEQEFGKNVDSLKKATARRVGYAVAATAVVGVAAAAVGGVIYFKNMLQTGSYEREAQKLYNEIMVELENPSKFKEGDLEELVVDSNELNKKVKHLLQVDYPQVHENADDVEKYKNAITKLFEARIQFAKAKKLAAIGSYIEALDVNVELGGIRDQLSESWHEFFDLFKDQYGQFRKDNSRFEYVSNQLKFAGKQLQGFNGEIKSLDEILVQGKVFEDARAKTLLGNVRSSLVQLGALEVSVGEGPGKNKLENLQIKLETLEDAIVGEKGLYTRRANLQATKVRNALAQIKTVLDTLEKGDYLGEKDAEEIKRIQKLLVDAENAEIIIDGSRLRDPRALTRKLIGYGTGISIAQGKVNEIAGLRTTFDNGDSIAGLRLIDKIFEHDCDDGKLDGDAVSLLERIPEDLRGSIGRIAEIYSRHDKKEGFIRVTNLGLTNSHLEAYRVAIEDYSNTKNVRPLKTVTGVLLKRTDSDSGKKVKSLLEKLSTAQDKRLDVEMTELPEDTTQEEIVKRDMNLIELKRQETEIEKEALVAVREFEKAARATLIEGNLEPPMSELEELAGLFDRKEEVEMRDKVQDRIAKLKKRYNW